MTGVPSRLLRALAIGILIPSIAGVAVPAGYRIDVVATGVTFPSGITLDGFGRPHAVETGYSYGEVGTPPRLVRIEGDGRLTVVQDLPSQGDHHMNGPVIGPDGFLYFGQGRFSRDDLVTHLRALRRHG